MSEDMLRPLQDIIAATFPERVGIVVSALEPLSAGWESDIHAFRITHGPPEARQSEELILRLLNGASAGEKAQSEFAGMRLLHHAGYPVPQVYSVESDPAPLGRSFIIMARAPGRALWGPLFRSPEPQASVLLALFCRLLVQLHTLEWQPWVNDPAYFGVGDPLTPIRRELLRLRKYLSLQPVAGFAPMVDWLEERVPNVPCARPAVIHWDFHPNNILAAEDGSAQVIDWTQVTIADPRLDLGWTLSLIGSYEGPAWAARILREYERQAGAAVEQLAYFEVFAGLKRLWSIVATLSGDAAKLGLRAGAADKMKGEARPTRYLYQQLLDRTGIVVPEVEALLRVLERP